MADDIISRNYKIKRGDNKNITVKFDASAEPLTNGGKITFTVKPTKKDVGNTDITNVIQIIEPLVVAGDNTASAVIRVTPTLNELPIKTYYYDVQFTSADKLTNRTLMEGEWRIGIDITRTV
jgi:hypothetical protein